MCFDTWAAVKAGGGSGKNRNKEIKVPCPFCRAPWELDLDHCDKVSLERARKVAATGRQMTLVGGAADAEYNNSNNSNNSNNDNDNDGEVVVVSEDGYVNVARELGIDGRRGTFISVSVFIFVLLLFRSFLLHCNTLSKCLVCLPLLKKKRKKKEIEPSPFQVWIYVYVHIRIGKDKDIIIAISLFFTDSIPVHVDYSMYHQPWVRSVARRGRFP